MAQNDDKAKNDAGKTASVLPVRDGVKNPAGQQGAPHDAFTTPQVIDRDELAKDEYDYDAGRNTLEVNRENPNGIFDNQRTQQAQENTVEVQNGIRNEDGTLKENHPAADESNPKIVKEDK